MKNKQIRDAYNQMNPSPEELERMKQRLMEQLPGDQPDRTCYTARPFKTRWWSVIPAAAACLAVLILGGFVLARSETHEPEASEQTVQAETTEAAETVPTLPEETTEPEETAPTAPDETLPTEPIRVTETIEGTPFGPGDYSDYITWAVARDWQERNNGIDPQTHCALYDVNGDGVEDLLIGNKDSSFREVITCLDGNLSLLFGVGRDCRICENGAIFSGEEGDSYYVIYRMSGLDHYVTSTLWRNETTGSWFLYNSSTQIEKTITKADAEAILDSYVPVEIEMVPIGSFKIK